MELFDRNGGKPEEESLWRNLKEFLFIFALLLSFYLLAVVRLEGLWVRVIGSKLKASS